MLGAVVADPAASRSDQRRCAEPQGALHADRFGAVRVSACGHVAAHHLADRLRPSQLT